jgi:hypothetical protein
MGFFSWKTADTKESIANDKSGHPNGRRPVYLLRPDGKGSVGGKPYGGYGFFDRVNAYKWLARNNTRFNSEHVGILLDCGDVAKGHDGKYYMFGHDAEELALLKDHIGEDAEVVHYSSGLDAITVNGETKTYNDWLAGGEFTRIYYSELVNIRYPLKFSYDPNAVYEDHPASENCPAQGFFYD